MGCGFGGNRVTQAAPRCVRVPANVKDLHLCPVEWDLNPTNDHICIQKYHTKPAAPSLLLFGSVSRVLQLQRASATTEGRRRRGKAAAPPHGKRASVKFLAPPTPPPLHRHPLWYPSSHFPGGLPPPSSLLLWLQHSNKCMVRGAVSALVVWPPSASPLLRPSMPTATAREGVRSRCPQPAELSLPLLFCHLKFFIIRQNDEIHCFMCRSLPGCGHPRL